MKHSLGMLGIAMMLVVSPAVAAEKIVPEFGKAKPLTVHDLNLHRERYDGKIVRVRGFYAYGTDTLRLESPARRDNNTPENPTPINDCISLQTPDGMFSKVIRAMVARNPRPARRVWKTPLTVIGLYIASTASTDPKLENVTGWITGCGAGSMIDVRGYER